MTTNTIEIKTTIDDLRIRGQYAQAHEFICSLPPKVCAIPSVAIDIIQLHLVQGHDALAAEACVIARKPLFVNASDLEHSAFTKEIFDVDSVCIELLTAYAHMRRFCELKAAKVITERIHGVWLGTQGVENLDLLEESTIQAGTNCLESIEQQRKELYSKSNIESETDGIDIQESRVLLEFWYLKIRLVLADQSLLDKETACSEAAASLDTLRFWCERRGRMREARHITYMRQGLFDNIEDEINILETFLGKLDEERYPIEKALTHLDLVFCLSKAADSDPVTLEQHSHYQEAERLFKATDHGFGHIDLMDARLEAKKDMDRKTRLQCKDILAKMYRDAGCYMKAIRCLVLSINSGLDEGGHLQTLKNIETILTEVERLGSNMVKESMLIQLIAPAIIRSSESGWALDILKVYFATPTVSMSVKHHGLLMTCFAFAQYNSGNHHLAVEHARKAFNIALTGHSYVDQSDAAYVLAHILSKDVQRQTLVSEEVKTRCLEARELIQVWVEKDRLKSYDSGERDKCLQLAGLEECLGIFSDVDDAHTRSQEWMERSMRCGNDTGVLVHSELITDLKLNQQVTQGYYEQALKTALDAYKACEENSTTTPFVRAQCAMRLSNQYRTQVHIGIGQARENSNPDWSPIIRSILEALKHAWEAVQIFQSSYGAAIPPLLLATECMNSAVDDYTTFLPQQGKDFLKTYLPEIEKTEKLYDDMRRNTSMQSGPIQSLTYKRNVTSADNTAKLYTFTAQGYLMLDDPEAAWRWMQKGKARALSDIFGSRALVPNSLMDEIGGDDDSHALFKQEKALTEAIPHASPQDYIILARKLEELRSSMRKLPLLKQLLGIREGALNLDLGQRLLAPIDPTHSNLSHGKVAYVDWFLPKLWNSYNDKIMMFVRRQGDKVHVFELPILLSEVQILLEEAYRVTREEQRLRKGDGNRFLARFSPLLAGIEDTTSENELLVLSPSGPLNKVPFHAISIGQSKRRLIERNPIIYSSSAAILQQCYHRATAQASKAPSLKSTKAEFFGVYEEEEFQEEQQSIFESIDLLSRQFPGGEAVKGAEVTKPEFVRRSKDASWVHYHGHAVYSKTDVLKSGLILSNGTENPRSSTESGIQAEGCGPDDLSVPEAFDLNMIDSAPHHTIIACDSGTQDIAPGDEPLGLIPALLFAGATSVLGCMWPTPSHAGRLFSELFYCDLSEQRNTMDVDGEMVCMLNLAEALRRAVCQMMNKEGTKAPYYWAPFVLYGAWFRVA
ncbi:uncharacterized protein BP5553_03612 [Venustampulla echinocandica]|uniref:CHAT domain-containing protein n=1 Tax=Venustampulla echinocandica TaxID=2656787 RepID=A0A370TUQ6_9HELO|nr:uncharacterized protein BP5553_03612 [Venustampulla echinocandica]RDL39272.1 hypothetical protein BP5553_03612 [Venustampulla echinocandica]